MNSKFGCIFACNVISKMKIRNEVKIGAVAVVALVLGYLGINFLKGINLFEPENRYHVRLENLNGTAVATPVMISGYKVGSVLQVSFAYDPSRGGYGADLVLGLDPGIQIPKGSLIKVKTNVLSGAELVITAPEKPEGGFLASGDKIDVAKGDDLMATLTDKVLPSVVDMLPELMATLKRVNQLVNNPAIDTMLISLNSSTQQLNKVMAKANETMQPMPQLVDNMNQLSKSLAQVGNKVERMPLDSLMLSVQATANNLKSMTADMRHLSAQLKGQEGTAGKLLNDPSLYNRLDSLANSADELMKDLKANPKRYVHFSIFGRKSQ